MLSVACCMPDSELATAAHTVHSSCTASIAAERCRHAATTDGDRRHREGAAGDCDGGAPGRLVRRAAASLQGTPQRRRCALVARMLHRVCFASLAHTSARRPSVRFYAVCLLACLLACLLVCLFFCDGPLRNTPLMARPTPHARRRVAMAYSWLAAQECVAAVRVRALVRHRQPRRAAAAQAHCTSAYA